MLASFCSIPRRIVLSAIGWCLAGGAFGLGMPAVAATDPGFLIGGDVSALPVLEQHGAVYRQDGRRGDALVILRRTGMNCFRLRLFVSPNHEGIVANDLAYTLALARRVKATGAALILDLHYSDTWADPAKQFKPAAWASLPFDQLVAQVGAYTRSVLAQFAREGVTPDIVQIGNEITNGMLWPDGRVEFAHGEELAAWSRLVRLLRAGIEAVGSGPGRPQVMLHVESTGNVPRTLAFFRHVQTAGLHFDLVGLSYYPEWHGGIADLKATLDAVAETVRKPIVVVETAYPWKPDEHWRGRPHLDWPLTPAGQREFLQAVVAAVRAVPGGLGRGVCYWYPESVVVPGVHSWLGGSCALFDDRGRLLPAAEFGLKSHP